MLKRWIEKLANQPVLFDAFRWILEAGFKGEKAVLRKEGVPNDNSVLDLGCGTGVLSEIFNPISYLGIDVNQRYIQRARNVHAGYRFLVMDGQNIGLESGTFDAAIISGVIHHLGDDKAKAILSEAHRVLKPATGRLILWEDVPTRHPLNFVGKLIQRLDVGEYMRSEQGYIELVRSVFKYEKHYWMSSGICDYIVIIAQKF